MSATADPSRPAEPGIDNTAEHACPSPRKAETVAVTEDAPGAVGARALDHRVRARHVARRIAAVAAAAALVLVLGAAQAEAIITVPIPADAPAAPPPIPSLPAAGEAAPPAEVISDPIEPGASCEGWHRQSSYAGIWPTDSTWWEYDCTLPYIVYPVCHDQPGFCEQGWWELGAWTDRFYWDGSRAVFYGENSRFGFMVVCEHWWDAPAGKWFAVSACPSSGGTANAAPTASFTSGCTGATCSFDGSGSSDSDGAIQAYGWDFGDGTSGAGQTAEHAYAEPGSYAVKLTVTDDDGATGTASKTVTVEPPPPPPNNSPTGGFAVSCAGLDCSLDAGTSSDSDGTIQAYGWDFGDGTSGAGQTAEHTYAEPGTYTVTLTVSDDDGATDTRSEAIALIRLSARGYKVSGYQRVDLSWNGSAGSSYDVYRDGRKIATTAANSYTDRLNRSGSGSYRYTVCETGGSICSSQAAVMF